MESINDRAWYAYHCLPRNERGRPPSYKSLEHDYGLPLAVLAKLFSGERKSVELKTLPKLAAALRVSPEWLLSGGDAQRPKLSGPMKPRAEQFAKYDPATWVEQHAANPAAVVPGQTHANPFEEAASALEDRLPRRLLSAEREKAKGREWDRPATGWMVYLLDRDDERPRREPKAEPAPPITIEDKKTG